MGGFRNQCEYIVWATKGSIDRREGGRCHPGVFRHVVRQADKHHLTGKPTPLMQDLVKIVPAGGVVLDPFMGSGTTGVAAIEAGLGFIGIEMSEIIFGIGKRRIDPLIV